MAFTKYDESKKAEDQARNLEVQAEYKKHIDEIKSGKKPIENISDAIIFYNPDENYTYLLRNLPLSATGKNYFIRGSLESAKDGVLLCDAGSKNYFALKPNNKTKGTVVGDLKLNGILSAVGTHIGNIPYTTRGGEEKMMPLLEAVYIASP